MAEITKEEANVLAEIFLSEYNSINNTIYTWDNDRSFPAEEPYDFFLYDGSTRLGIQVVRAVADATQE